jgi:hypothetical protein
LTALRRIQAAATGQAQELAMFRHRHLSDRPLVIVPLMLAGEAAAPVAVALGTSSRRPMLIFVHQPRDRDQRFRFAADLGDTVLRYIEEHRTLRRTETAKRGGEAAEYYAEAPQILVPNPGGIKALSQFARMTRFRSATGPHAVAPGVPMLGRWLTFFADRAEQADSALLVAATALLVEQWATGQSPEEDGHLGALLGWIDPPAHRTGMEEALLAEDAHHTPPAGPATDPDFDNNELFPAVGAYQKAQRAGDQEALAQAQKTIEQAVATQLMPTWEAMWRAISLLRNIPESAGASDRWRQDRGAFTRECDRIEAGGAPQPRRDAPDAAAKRLNYLEATSAAYEFRRAMEDPFVLADLRTVGMAFSGTVTEVDPCRTVQSETSKRRKLRPEFTLVTDEQPYLLTKTKLASPDLPATCRMRIIGIETEDGRSKVRLELIAGMGQGNTAARGSLPKEGTWLQLTGAVDYYVPLEFLSGDQTPWTHQPLGLLEQAGEVDEQGDDL